MRCWFVGAVLSPLLLLCGCRGATPPAPADSNFRAAPAVVSTASPHQGAYFLGKDLCDLPMLLPCDEASQKSVQIDAVRKVIELAPGVNYSAWTFGGSMPGPTLHVREGDVVHFSMTNRDEGLAEGVPPPNTYDRQAITFHGSDIPPAANFRTVARGQTIAFDFKASHRGLFLYHSSAPMMLESVACGLFGAMVVEPRQGWPTHADREYVVIQSELYARLRKPTDTLYTLDPVAARSGQVSYTLMNGRLYGLVRHPLKARPGERVRLYLLNAGPNHSASLQMEQLLFDRVWMGGNPDNQMRGLQSVTLSPGESAIVEFEVPQEGRYVLLDHHLNMAVEGAAGMLDATSGSEHHEVVVPAAASRVAEPPPTNPAARQGYLLFQRRCSICHAARLGAKVGWEGPNLAGVTRHRDQDWLRRWLRSPQAVLADDASARQMLDQYRYPMPEPNLSSEEVDTLIHYLRWLDARS